MLRPLTLLLAIVLGAMVATALPNAAHASGPPQLQKAQGGDKCIRELPWMRRNHMDFLKHKREITVREGIRDPHESLINCQSCHTQRAQFCDKCHTYVGVQPDCFECHNYPE